MSGSSQEITQTFGWPYGSAGALALALSVGPWVAAKTSTYRPMATDYQAAALCVVGGLLAVVWELWRRRGRVVLGRVPGGIGVYRKGELQRVALPSEITIYRWSDTHRIAYWGLGFFLLMATVATVGKGGNPFEIAYYLLLCVLAGAWLASHIWVRSNLTQLWLPTRPGKTRSILIPKRMLPELFGPAAAPSAARPERG